mgnify:CR=1 FL=1
MASARIASRFLAVSSSDSPFETLEPDARGDLLTRLRDAALGTPGVQSAALSAVTPISGSTWSYRLELIDGKPIETVDKSVFVTLVSPEWLQTYATKMLSGREFTEVIDLVTRQL